jgi:hypothetical protein
MFDLRKYKSSQLINIDAEIDGMAELMRKMVALVGAEVHIEIDLCNPRFATVSLQEFEIALL